MNEFNFKSYGNSNQTISYCEVDKCKAVVELKQQLDQLKAENDKYSLFIEKLCDYAGLECDDEEQAMRTLSDLASQMNKARWIIDRYKQTLTEIKEIMKKHCRKCKKHKFYHFQLCCTCKYTDILQKISEVEDANI